MSLKFGVKRKYEADKDKNKLQRIENLLSFWHSSELTSSPFRPFSRQKMVAIRKFPPRISYSGRDPFNQNSNRSDRENWSTSNGGPIFFETFLVGPNRSIEFWTEISGNFGRMDCAPWNTKTQKTDRNPPITNHKQWPFEPVEENFCFLRGR